MGYTHETTRIIDPYLPHIKSVVDLGAQNDYRVPLPAPYTKDSYYAGKDYEAIDISGENGSTSLDLSKLHKFDRQYDLLVDAGTSEHVGTNGKHDIKAIYNCWKNKQTSLNSEVISSPKTQKQATGPDMDSTTTPKRSTFVWLKSAAILLSLLVALLLWAILLMGGTFTRFYKRLKKSFVR